MDILSHYLARSKEIIGERTPEEIRYDSEVIRWLNRGKPVKKAILKANQKYPPEALEISAETLSDIKNHYEYLAEHESIMRKMEQYS